MYYKWESPERIIVVFFSLNTSAGKLFSPRQGKQISSNTTRLLFGSFSSPQGLPCFQYFFVCHLAEQVFMTCMHSVCSVAFLLLLIVATMNFQSLKYTKASCFFSIWWKIRLKIMPTEKHEVVGYNLIVSMTKLFKSYVLFSQM